VPEPQGVCHNRPLQGGAPQRPARRVHPARLEAAPQLAAVHLSPQDAVGVGHRPRHLSTGPVCDAPHNGGRSVPVGFSCRPAAAVAGAPVHSYRAASAHKHSPIAAAGERPGTVQKSAKAASLAYLQSTQSPARLSRHALRRLPSVFRSGVPHQRQLRALGRGAKGLRLCDDRWPRHCTSGQSPRRA
jgi:hypothetical protein